MTSDKDKSKAEGRLTRNRVSRKVKEAGLAYITNEAGSMPKTTISSKNQITIPARLLREMGLKPGDQLAVELDGLRLILHPRPKDWVSYTAGSMKGVYGETKEDIDAYIEELRGEWGEFMEPSEAREERKSSR